MGRGGGGERKGVEGKDSFDTIASDSFDSIQVDLWRHITSSGGGCFARRSGGCAPPALVAALLCGALALVHVKDMNNMTDMKDLNNMNEMSSFATNHK